VCPGCREYWILVTASMLHKHLRYDMILYHNPKICKLIWVECVPSCVWEVLHFQEESPVRRWRSSERPPQRWGIGVGDPRRSRSTALAERSERPPARRGRARLWAGEAAELLGEEDDPRSGGCGGGALSAPRQRVAGRRVGELLGVFCFRRVAAAADTKRRRGRGGASSDGLTD
jgi:hypothetical protein